MSKLLSHPSPTGQAQHTAFETDRIINADCLEALKDFPDECIDLTVFSPPYDGIRDYSGDWKLDYHSLGEQLMRITRDGGIAAVVIGDGTKNFAKSLTTFRWAVDWVDRVGWRMFECCIYARHGNPGAWWTQRFRVDHEYILIFLKGARPRYFNKQPLMIASRHAGKVYSGTDRLTSGGFKKIESKAVNDSKCRGTLWNYATSNTEGNRTKLEHPATFPDKLAEDLVLCFADKGDVVLDPMCGSGTTAVVAVRNNRRFVGIEINPDYCDIIRRRIDTETQSQCPPIPTANFMDKRGVEQNTKQRAPTNPQRKQGSPERELGKVPKTTLPRDGDQEEPC